jgi:hypothetical protein
MSANLVRFPHFREYCKTIEGICLWSDFVIEAKYSNEICNQGDKSDVFRGGHPWGCRLARREAAGGVLVEPCGMRHARDA